MCADFAELGDFFDLPVRIYSSGMIVRLAFAMATAIRPQVLLMDEWFLAGDASFRKKAQRPAGGHGARAPISSCSRPISTTSCAPGARA